MLKKLFQPKKTKFFWLYFVGGILLTIIGVMLMPVWSNVEWAFWKSYGTDIINIVICGCLLLFLFGFFPFN